MFPKRSTLYHLQVIHYRSEASGVTH